MHSSLLFKLDIHRLIDPSLPDRLFQGVIALPWALVGGFHQHTLHFLMEEKKLL